MSARTYPITVHHNGVPAPGEPILAVDDADARRQAGSLAAAVPAGVSITLADDAGVVLGEYRRGGGWQ